MRMKTLSILLLVLFVLSACSKSLTGTYVDDRGNTLTLTSSGNWTASDGGAGTYKIDGDTVIFSGAFGISLAGKIEGNVITMNARDLFTGKSPSYVKQ